MDATSHTPIYLIAAHPNWRESRINRKLLETARRQSHVQVCDLYGRYPDYHIDVAAEQAHLAAAQLVVLVHPIQWYSMPSLQKLWLDEVLAYDWAYGEGGHALRGKDLWLVATTGGPAQSYHASGYNRYAFDAFLPPYEQTAALCGMRFLPPLVLYGAHTVGPEVVQRHLSTFSNKLSTYPQWPELASLAPRAEPAVPANDRPTGDAVTAATRGA
ncbi:MAG: hypothetical protein RIR09_1815 [Pseudomonadota bacterium]|jgi:glutathione-regulated potassium-efflux system ancillary protein KefF